MYQQHLEFSNLQALLSQENSTYVLDTAQKRKHLTNLQLKNDCFEKFKNTIIQLQDLKEIENDPNADPEMLAFSKEEIINQQEILDELQEDCISLLIPKSKFDDCSEIYLEVRPGTGGSESSLFAEELLKMYQSYSGLQSYSCKIESFQADMSINKGCKLGILKIEGEDIYKRLANESGVHKITHIPTGVSVLCQDERYQERNKARALKLLSDKLYQLEVEKYNEEQSSMRKNQIGSGERSDKIRTYNFPQDRITDHRSNLTLFGIEKMMEGLYLDQFIDQYQEKVNNEKIVQMLKQLEEEKNQ